MYCLIKKSINQLYMNHILKLKIIIIIFNIDKTKGLKMILNKVKMYFLQLWTNSLLNCIIIIIIKKLIT